MSKKLLFMYLSFLLSSLSLNAAERTYADRNFFDQEKNEGQVDRNACWAACAANIVMSWQNYLKKSGVKIPSKTPTRLEKIYEDIYRLGNSSKKIIVDGNSVSNGIAWFIAGVVYQEDTNKVSGGGYWKESFPEITSPANLCKFYNLASSPMTAKELDALFAASIKNNTRLSFGLDCDAFEDGEKVPSHAITFWGYESRNSKAYYVYITDSDDEYKGKKRFTLSYEKDKKIYLKNYSANKDYYISSIMEFAMPLPVVSKK